MCVSVCVCVCVSKCVCVRERSKQRCEERKVEKEEEFDPYTATSLYNFVSYARTYLIVSLSVSVALSSEQSLPPYPTSHEHEAVQVTSRIVQFCRGLLDGSENRHLPWFEHTDPKSERERVRECV